ncbi:hypothetical protein R9X44_19855 [Actinocorallia sp. A-T 12471]|nr:hypothetical protein [Actinocorallia sp. A-T 12471]MDX6742052.1 hypothetical protein [Actinocorallia sp. A-T 12471]
MFAVLASWLPETAPTRLAGLSVTAFLRALGKSDPGRIPHLVIDAAEELFAPSSADEARMAFLDDLAEALTGRADFRLLLSVREERLTEALAFAERVADPGRVPLGPLDRASAATAIRAPLGPGHPAHLPDLLAADLSGGRRGEPDSVDPALLQAVCTRLFPPKPPEALPAPVEHRSGTPPTKPGTPETLQGPVEHRRGTFPTKPGTPETRPGQVEHGPGAFPTKSAWPQALPGPVEYGSGADPGPDVDQALADFAAAVLARVAALHRMTPDQLTGWFRDVFAPKSGGARVVYEEEPRTAGMPVSVLRDLVDGHLLRVHRHRDGQLFYRLTHPRLVRPVQAVRPASAYRPSPEDRLCAADKALHRGEYDLARANAEAALGHGSLRVHAAAETTLGNIAYERGLPEVAAEHYRAAAVTCEAMQDTTAVGRLLAAIGRLRLGYDDTPERAVADLHAAVGRVPHDPAIQTGLGRALWFAGRPVPALAVLSGVLALDGAAAEALGTRAEILADLGDPVSAASALRDLDRLACPPASTGSARALALAVLDRPKEARAALEDAAAEEAESALVLLRAARVAALTGDPVAAARLAARAAQATAPPLPAHLHPTARDLARPGA